MCEKLSDSKKVIIDLDQLTDEELCSRYRFGRKSKNKHVRGRNPHERATKTDEETMRCRQHIPLLRAPVYFFRDFFPKVVSFP